MGAWTEPSNSFAATVIDGPSSGPAYGAPVPGTAVDHERVMNSHAVQLIVSIVNNGGGQFYLEGSLDGTNFYTLSSTVGVSPGTQILVVENMPAQYVRGMLTPYSGDSSNPVLTVSALVVAQEES